MRLSDKLSCFLSGRPLPHTSTLTTRELPRVNHRTRGTEGYYFEPHSMLNVSWIFDEYGANRWGFIGSHSYINDGGYIRGPVFIGRYCSIGRRVTLGAGGHSTGGLSSSPRLRGATALRYTPEQLTEIRSTGIGFVKTVIGSDVWIGDGAIVMPGVTIAEGAVIGANAVVTKDVRPYEIRVGAPAKPVGRRFSESLIERLLKTHWWEYAHEDLSELPTGNVFEFLDRFQLAAPLAEAHFPTYTLKC